MGILHLGAWGIESLRRAVELADAEGRENFSPVPQLELGVTLQDLGRPRMARGYLEFAVQYPATREEALRRLQR